MLSIRAVITWFLQRVLGPGFLSSYSEIQRGQKDKSWKRQNLWLHQLLIAVLCFTAGVSLPFQLFAGFGEN